MKRLIIMALVCMFLLSGVVYAETTVSSNIITDTTWTKAGSPYLITQSIDVYSDVTLIIEPGVKIKFNSGSNLEVYENAALIAIGSETDLITFTSDQEIPSATGWGGIIFKEGSLPSSWDDSGNYIGGSIIKYCSIENVVSNGNWWDYELASILTKVNLFITNSYISNTSNAYAIINNSESIIANNSIKDNDWAILNNNTARINNNTISDNKFGGIRNTAPYVDISYNTVTNNGGNYAGGSSGIWNGGDHVTTYIPHLFLHTPPNFFII